jgi:hypothetical protein
LLLFLRARTPTQIHIVLADGFLSGEDAKTQPATQMTNQKAAVVGAYTNGSFTRPLTVTDTANDRSINVDGTTQMRIVWVRHTNR